MVENALRPTPSDEVGYEHNLHIFRRYEVALVSLETQKLARSPCWYYWRQEIKKYKDRVISIGMMFIHNLVQKLLQATRISMMLAQTYVPSEIRKTVYK
jgi:hypothetical protein